MVKWAERSIQEEKYNSLTHALGFTFLLSVLFREVSLPETVYSLGASCTLLLSTLYHGIESGKLKNHFRMLDMVSIHILISVTAISYIVKFGGGVLVCLPSTLVGCYFAYRVYRKYDTFSLEREAVALYIVSGALCFVSVFFSAGTSTALSLFYFVSGVIVYLLGLIFYLRDYKKWYHTMWHLFVLVGVVLHLIGLATT